MHGYLWILVVNLGFVSGKIDKIAGRSIIGGPHIHILVFTDCKTIDFKI